MKTETIKMEMLNEQEAINYLRAELKTTTSYDRAGTLTDTLECIDQTGVVPEWVQYEWNLRKADPQYTAITIIQECCK